MDPPPIHPLRVAIIGRGNMAQEAIRVCTSQGVPLIAVDQLVCGDVAIHFGSGRELAHALAECARAEVPLIQGSTSIVLPDPLPAAVIEAPNLAFVIVQLVAGLGPLRGSVHLLRESHQAGKADVSRTARMLARRLAFPEAKIESIRNPGAQQALGVPPEHLDGHAWHWIQCRTEGVEVDVSIRINGREPYARGALALARQLSGRRLRPGIYAVEDILAWVSTGESKCGA